MTYFSPEQIWLNAQLGTHAHDEASYHELKHNYPVTPATCDLYASMLVVLEMHSRAGPRKNDPKNKLARVEAVRHCAARKPRETAIGLSPEETEQWLVRDLGFAKLEGKVASNGVSGELIMRLPSLTLTEAKQERKDIPRAVVLGLHNTAKKALLTLSTPTDSMHENVAALLEKGLSPNVVERPVTASCALKKLMVHGLHQHLPEGAKAKSFNHNDEDVASTLGGLAKLMVLHGDIPSALTTCAEWLGTTSHATTRANAQGAYCNLLKRHGDEVRGLELSILAHSNWSPGMLEGAGFVDQLALSVWERGRPVFETIDMSKQSKLSGEVLSKMLRTTGIPTLRRLVLRDCNLATGEVPVAIRHCTALVTLDLHGAGHTGEIPAVLVDLSSLESLNLGHNRFRGTHDLCDRISKAATPMHTVVRKSSH